MNFNEAVNLLKNAVKESNIKGQKHIDFSLVNVDEITEYEEAMKIVNESVVNNELTRDELLTKLGIK